MVGAQPMARSRKHSALASASLALTVALLVSGVAAKAAPLAPSAGGGGNVTGAVGDPRTGPHAREEARHAGQPLTLAPATTTASPLRLNASNLTVTRSRVANPGAAALLPSNPKLAREVFGFAPYWALSGNGNWDYSLLSTIAYFGLDVQSDGSFSTSATNNGFKGWMSQDLVNVINRAHASSDRVVLVIKAFDNATINAIVSNPNASQNAINWTIQSIRSRNLDGVNIDFEGSSSSSYPNLQSQFSAFVANLSNQVHAAIPGFGELGWWLHEHHAARPIGRQPVRDGLRHGLRQPLRACRAQCAAQRLDLQRHDFGPPVHRQSDRVEGDPGRPLLWL